MGNLTLAAIQAVTKEAALYRSFNHLVAAGRGWTLAIPLALIHGDLKALVDGCPVPHDELLAVVHSRKLARVMHGPDAAVFSPLVNSLTLLAPAEWWFAPMRYPRGDAPVGLFSHPSGMHFAATTDVLFVFQAAPDWRAEAQPMAMAA